MEFTLENDPQPYVLRFDFNALVAAEAKTGQNLMAAIGAWPALDCTQARALLFALLLPAHPAVLVEEAGGLFTRDLDVVWRSMRFALVEASVLEVEEVKPKVVAEVKEAGDVDDEAK